MNNDDYFTKGYSYCHELKNLERNLKSVESFMNHDNFSGVCLKLEYSSSGSQFVIPHDIAKGVLPFVKKSIEESILVLREKLEDLKYGKD